MPEQQRFVVTLLDEEDERSVLVTRKNEDRFIISAPDAVNACFLFDSAMSRMRDQITSLLAHLSDWIGSHRERIKSAHVAFRNKGDILFLVTQREVAFDQKLCDALADLDSAVACDPDFDAIQMEVLAIPCVSRASAAAFLSSGHVITHAK